MTDTAAPKPSRTNALTVFLSVSSAAAIVLALLGYGVALSAEASFGVPHAIIFNSTSDLLTLGGWAVMHMLSYIDKLQQWGFYAGIWMKFWPIAKLALAMVVVGFLVGVAAFGGQRLMSRWGWAKSRQTQLQRLVSKHDRLAKSVAFPALILLGIFAAWPLAMIALLFGLALLGFFLGIVPIAGLLAGTGHTSGFISHLNKGL